MRVLVVYCHPCADSFNAAVRDTALETLAENGHEVHMLDLYGMGFDPVMHGDEWRRYGDKEANLEPVYDRARELLWAQAVVFIYPTWWYGLPAMLKGWLERVLVPGFAFEMPTATRGPRPKLRHIRKVLVMTTCGATPFMSWIMGQPGRRTLLRGFRSVCHPLCATKFLALYRMDSVSPAQRQTHLQRVRKTLATLGRARSFQSHTVPAD
ncbi:NAD(P)H-dependent oxidoreductase [Mesorhizobium sp. ES1-1]|uniref:NAD(P)H-dependent oxidoreductase n=1 Tax=Mesorhizobium sp. ES1-1 TaxID=2876629 RepID=UPI001CCA3460|nr:NAD(P)H-dependent oxidoreductase [Mesorhizobium sp. ES1-1]MBZ9675486.1 NAD(P)H-dependent oxidoreductase [Mesorhizobium sp. ES1-1]